MERDRGGVARGSRSAGWRRPDAVAVTGQWAGTVAVGEDGEPLHPAITWLDARGAPHAQRLAGGPGRRLRAAEGRPLAAPDRRRAVAQRPRPARPHPLAAHERPDVYARTTRLPRADRLARPQAQRPRRRDEREHHAALGRRHARPRDAPLRRRPAARSPASSAPSCPSCCPASAVLGELTAAAAAADLGVEPGMPVVAGSPDTMSAAVGSGAVADHAAHLYVGHLVVDLVPRPVQAHRPAALDRLAAGRAARPLHRVVRAADRGRVAGARARRVLPGRRGDDGYDAARGAAPRAAPSRAAAASIFTPWLNGERTPVDDHLVRGGLLQPLARDRAARRSRARCSRAWR